MMFAPHRYRIGTFASVAQNACSSTICISKRYSHSFTNTHTTLLKINSTKEVFTQKTVPPFVHMNKPCFTNLNFKPNVKPNPKNHKSKYKSNTINVTPKLNLLSKYNHNSKILKFNHNSKLSNISHCAPFPFWPVVHVLYKYSFVFVRYSYRLLPEWIRRKIADFIIKHTKNHRFKLRALLATFWFIGWYLYFDNIEETPISHRRRFIYIPNAQLYEQNMHELNTVLDAAKKNDELLPESHILHKRVAKVVNDIECVAKNLGIIDDNFEFKVYVVDTNEKNAFALPFGQVIVFTPMITDSDDELAILLGHEISHCLCKHASEQLSKSGVFVWLDSIIFLLLSVLFPDHLTWGLQEFFRLQVMDVFTELPMSRKCESEADYVGLVLATRAGYDPTMGVKMWEDMSKEHGNNLAKWFSTHPTHESRANDIKEWIPQILRQSLYHVDTL